MELTDTIIKSISEIYSTVLISIWITFLLINLIITAIFKGNKKSWGDFWWIWFITASITGIIIGFIIMMPEQILELINDIKELFI